MKPRDTDHRPGHAFAILTRRVGKLEDRLETYAWALAITVVVALLSLLLASMALATARGAERQSAPQSAMSVAP